jgi:hypothetical protein
LFFRGNYLKKGYSTSPQDRAKISRASSAITATVPARDLRSIRLGETLDYGLLSISSDIIVQRLEFKDLDMSSTTKIAMVAAFATALSGTSHEASARERSYPLTRCGPDLAYLCPIHGYFDSTPFRYGLAIYPGCIKIVPVQTPYGIERRRTLVCG